jgi:hypothetical protein
MTVDWQDFIALSLVALCAGYLAWRGWLVVRRKQRSCGGCNKCPAQSLDNGKALVTLEPTREPVRRVIKTG